MGIKACLRRQGFARLRPSSFASHASEDRSDFGEVKTPGLLSINIFYGGC